MQKSILKQYFYEDETFYQKYFEAVFLSYEKIEHKFKKMSGYVEGVRAWVRWPLMQERDSQEGFQSAEEFTGKLQAFMHTASLRRNNMNMKSWTLLTREGSLCKHPGLFILLSTKCDNKQLL